MLPRMMALILMMPRLCLYSDFVGIMGGATIGKAEDRRPDGGRPEGADVQLRAHRRGGLPRAWRGLSASGVGASDSRGYPCNPNSCSPASGVFLNPPKESADAAISAMAQDGVAVKIITGDKERVATHLCGQLKVKVLGVLTGDEIAALSDEAVLVQVRVVNLFCRITPPQKLRVPMTLKRAGRRWDSLATASTTHRHCTAADVGISVDSTTDVANAAADIVLLERDLLLLLFRTTVTHFRTGWFIESLVTQILMIFAVRTRYHLFASRPRVAVTLLAVGSAALTLALPFLPIGFGLSSSRRAGPTTSFLALVVLGFLIILEAAKRVFYATWPV